MHAKPKAGRVFGSRKQPVQVTITLDDPTNLQNLAMHLTAIEGSRHVAVKNAKADLAVSHNQGSATITYKVRRGARGKTVVFVLKIARDKETVYRNVLTEKPR